MWMEPPGCRQSPGCQGCPWAVRSDSGGTCCQGTASPWTGNPWARWVFKVKLQAGMGGASRRGLKGSLFLLRLISPGQARPWETLVALKSMSVGFWSGHSRLRKGSPPMPLFSGTYLARDEGGGCRLEAGLSPGPSGSRGAASHGLATQEAPHSPPSSQCPGDARFQC